LSEDRQTLQKAYRRAAIGLGVAAIMWIAAFLVGGLPDGSAANWLIPIAAAGLSMLFFSLYSKMKNAGEDHKE